MNTVHPMEIENNYYSYRDTQKKDDVYPVLYLDNGLTLYTDEKNKFLYDNKEDTDIISENKIGNLIKKFSKKRTEKTEAEKKIEKLEHILIDFENDKNKNRTNVTVMVNPNVSIPPSTTRASTNRAYTTRASTTTIDPSECIEISADELKQKMLETVEGTEMYEQFDTLLKETSKEMDMNQEISFDCEFIDNFSKDKNGFNVDMCSKDPSIINELSPKLGFNFRNVCKKTCNNKCSSKEIIHGIKEPPECTNVSAEDLNTLIMFNAPEEEKTKSQPEQNCELYKNTSLCEKSLHTHLLNKRFGFNISKMCKKTCNNKCSETTPHSSRQPTHSSGQPTHSSGQPTHSSGQPTHSSTTVRINKENRLTNNERKSLIDIGDSVGGCPDIKTPSCYFGFSLKYDNRQCPYTVCYDKMVINLVIDMVLAVIALAIMYNLYLLAKK